MNAKVRPARSIAERRGKPASTGNTVPASTTYETSLKSSPARSLLARGPAFGLCVLAVLAVLAPSASALADDAGVREAARHFQRGVGLYREADYRGALVEFQRAWDLVPATATLYNIGETEFQLREYAAALTAFERYLAQSPPDDRHRAEVEASAEVLRTRVGYVQVTTSPPGADITVDDQAVGKAPFESPLRVSIGHHKVVASVPGRQSAQGNADVAAEDHVTVNLTLGAPASFDAFEEPSSASSPVEGSSNNGATWRALGWVATSALAGGGLGFGLLANKHSNDLREARGGYPVSRDTLNHEANVTTAYAIAADSLVGAAILMGGITLFSTMSASAGPHVTAGLSSVHFTTTF